MTEQTYRGFIDSIGRTRLRVRLLRITDKGIVIVTAAAYGLFLLCLFFEGSSALIPSMLVPAVSLLAVTLIRSGINAPRPYEVYGFEPVLEKDTLGKSFPSRHVFSIFCIAATMWHCDASIAMPLLLLGVILAILRVAGGVHFVKDVVAGAAAGVICSVVGFFLAGFGPLAGVH